MALAILAGLATALSNALALTTQHLASARHPSPPKGMAFVAFLLRQPLWLAGWLALGGSLVFQTIALHAGSLALVQPLLVSELVLALVLRRAWLGQQLTAGAWWSALVTTTALAVFLTLSRSSGDHDPTARSWLVVGALCAAVTLSAVIVGRRGNPARRAASFGLATAVSWAFEATLIKALGTEWVRHGVAGTLQNWVFYVFCVAGIVGLLCEQTALHVGPLGVSQPVIVIADPLVSIGLGVGLYAEYFEGSAWQHVAAITALVVTCLGAWRLMRLTPPLG